MRKGFRRDRSSSSFSGDLDRLLLSAGGAPASCAGVELVPVLCRRRRLGVVAGLLFGSVRGLGAEFGGGVGVERGGVGSSPVSCTLCRSMDSCIYSNNGGNAHNSKLTATLSFSRGPPLSLSRCCANMVSVSSSLSWSESEWGSSLWPLRRRFNAGSSLQYNFLSVLT